MKDGDILGPYHLLGKLGEGGMGEVYRARDTRLDRVVAIKVLTGALASDAESRQRFEHEARVIAALNDPHICTIHDVGRHGDLDYLVLEYLEGETLGDRLRRTPALTIAEALAIGVQIGDALDRAHHAGIVHRDLKPGNVMLLNRGGTSTAPLVKLLDFGLAARTAGARPTGLTASLGETITAPPLEATRAASVPASGFSGTVQYMAPEQIDGDPGDHRTDIFAFGCVLYEMLGGRKAFEGSSAVSVIAAIASTEPPPIASLQGPHLSLDHVLRRCLEKDRERRWQNIRDVTGELRWIAEQPVAQAAAVSPARINRAVVVLLAASILWGLVALGFLLSRGGGAIDQPAYRLEISTAPTDDPSIALSSDGRQIAFVANQHRVPLLWVRSLDAVEAKALPGTEGASFPFWSPDGRTLGFFASDKLKRIDVAGGTPIVLADARNGRGAAWNADGVILFSPNVSGQLSRVSSGGGAVEQVTDLASTGGRAHRFPQFLPDGKRFLFTSQLGSADTNGVYLGSLDKTPPTRVILATGVGRFVAPDRLVVVNQTALQAFAFDPASGTVSGQPTVIAQGFAGGASSSGNFAASNTGLLAYRAGAAQRRQLVWVNRQGTVVGTVGEPDADYVAAPELSADDRSVAVFRQPTGVNDIWTTELGRNLSRRVTDGSPGSTHPLWDPDGQHVVFGSPTFGGGPTRQGLNGAKPAPLFATGERGLALSWTRDRRYLLVRRVAATGAGDLVALNTTDPSQAIAVTQSQADEAEGQFSPDGRWVAFVSNESGREEVFVQTFPDGGARTQISTGGGAQVRWSADGREMFYLAADGKMMAVSIATEGARPVVAAPVALFATHLATGINVLGSKPQYAVARDGRFLLNTVVESASAPIVIAINWDRGRQ